MDINEQIVFLAAKLCWPKKRDADIFILLNDDMDRGKREVLWLLQAKMDRAMELKEIEQQLKKEAHEQQS